MRKQLAALVVAGSAVFGLVASPPAHAEDTDATFTLTAAGGLSISVPVSKELSAGTATNAGSLTAQLGEITVTDARGALVAAWAATVSSTDFTTGAASAAETIGKANVAYWSGAATASTGSAVFTPGQADAAAKVPLAVAAVAFAGAGVGNNEAKWNPTIVVTIPSAAVVGAYAGVITHSAA